MSIVSTIKNLFTPAPKPTATQQYVAPIGPQQVSQAPQATKPVSLPGTQKNTSSPVDRFIPKSTSSSNALPQSSAFSSSSGGGGNSPSLSSSTNLVEAVDGQPSSPTPQGPLQSLQRIPTPSIREPINQKDLPVDRKNDGFFGGVKNIYNRVTGSSSRMSAEEKQQRILQQGIRQRSFTPSGRGTLVTTQNPYSDTEIVDLAKVNDIGERPAIKELSRRQDEKLDKEFTTFISGRANTVLQSSKVELQQSQAEAQREIADYASTLDLALAQGQIDPERRNALLQGKVSDVNRQLKAYVDALNKDNQRQIEENAKEYADSTGKRLQQEANTYLNRLKDKIDLGKAVSDLPFYVAAGLATGGLGTVIEGSAATAAGARAASVALRATGTVLTGAAAAKTSYDLTTAYLEGNLTSEKIAAAIIPFAGFGLGAGVGARIAAGPKVDVDKLRSVIERSEIQTDIIRGLTSETQIARLKMLPQELKPQLIQYIKNGASIKELKLDIKPKSKLDIEVLQRGLPQRNIRVFQVIEQDGNRINVLSVGKAKTGKGLIEKETDMLSYGEGYYDPAQEKAVIDTLNLQVDKRGVVQASRTGEIIKGSKPKNLEVAQLLPDGRFKVSKGRQLESEGITVKAGKKIAEPNKSLSLDDIRKVGESAYERAVSTSKTQETQVLKSTSKQAKLLSKNTAKVSRRNIYKTTSGSSTSAYIPEAIPFERGTKKGKIDDVIGEINEALSSGSTKPRATGKGSGSQKLQQQIERDLSDSFSSVDNPRISDVSAAIKDSLDEAAVDLNKGSYKTSSGLSQKQLKSLPRQQDQEKRRLKNTTRQLQAENITLNDVMNPEQTQSPFENIDQQIRQLSSQNQPSAQVNAPQLRTKQISVPGISSTGVALPQIRIPGLTGGIDIPFPNGGQGGGSQEGKRRRGRPRKTQAAYTASLGAAAFQEKALKVTKKQLAKLNEQTYSGLETRPVLEVVDDKKIKKALKKVDFY